MESTSVEQQAVSTKVVPLDPLRLKSVSCIEDFWLQWL